MIETRTDRGVDHLFMENASLVITPGLDGTFVLSEGSENRTTAPATIGCSDLADLLQRIADQYS